MGFRQLLLGSQFRRLKGKLFYKQKVIHAFTPLCADNIKVTLGKEILSTRRVNLFLPYQNVRFLKYVMQ